MEAQNQLRLKFIEQRNFIHNITFVIVFDMRFKIAVVGAHRIIRQIVKHIQIASAIGNMGLISVEMFVINKRNVVAIEKLSAFQVHLHFHLCFLSKNYDSHELKRSQIHSLLLAAKPFS